MQDRGHLQELQDVIDARRDRVEDHPPASLQEVLVRDDEPANAAGVDVVALLEADEDLAGAAASITT